MAVLGVTMTTDGGDDPGRETERGIMSVKQQSYITTASAMEGVLTIHTDRGWFTEGWWSGLSVCLQQTDIHMV